MATITSITPFTATAQNGNGGNVPVPEGTNRKMLAMFTDDTTQTISAMTFGGVSMLANLAEELISTIDTNTGCAAYWVDIDDETAAGDVAFAFNQTANTSSRRVYCVMLVDAEPGAPGWADSELLEGTGAGPSFDLVDVTEDAAVVAIWACDSSTATVSWGAAVTEDYDESVNSAYASSLATADEVAAGTKTIAATIGVQGATREQVVVAVAVAHAAASGPTISTQPSAATAIVSPSEPAVFTVDCAAATTGMQWQDDGTNISGADIAQVDTLASGTSVLTVTPTATTRTGSAITCECTDNSGMTESNAATLTVRAGVTETQVSETTDGDGEVAGTLATDVQGDALEKRIAFVAIKVNGTELVGPGMWLVGLAP